METFTIGDVRVGGDLFLIAGPCVMEDEPRTIALAGAIRDVARRFSLGFVFKSSFDKANRSSYAGFRGPGLQKGLEILTKVKSLGIPVLSDIHEPAQAGPAAEVLDCIQIPALLCRQTSLLEAAAATNLPVSVKKGQFMSPEDMGNVLGKLTAFGCRRVILTERGTTFGYHNLVVDMRAIPIMRALGAPVVFDATHSVQLPGGEGDRSGGTPAMIPALARAAVAAGADGLFLEVHENPAEAPCDADCQLPLDRLAEVLGEARAIRAALEACRGRS